MNSRRIGRGIQRFAFGILALVMVFSVLGSRVAFAECRANGRVHWKSCCAEKPHETDVHATGTTRFERAACCEIHHVHALSSLRATVYGPDAILPAPLMGEVLIAWAFADDHGTSWISVRTEWRVEAARAGPGPAPPLFALHRSYRN